MTKIKILFYAHAIDFRGTWRAHERTLLNLNTNIFDVYVFYNPNAYNNRLNYLKTKLPENKIIPFETSYNKTGPENGWSWVETNFFELCETYNFDIIHVARSGYFEWPFVRRICPIQIETNIFGFNDSSEFLDYSVAISNFVSNRRGGSDKMIYYPVQRKLTNNETLFDEFNIKKGIPIFGRIGAGEFCSISFEALSKYKNMGYDFRYIIICPCQNVIDTINNLNLNDNCILIDCTSDDDLIHKFNNTIDIFLHYRSNGETFGLGIGQSLMYGKPVISHTAYDNAQVEVIGNGGYVCHNSDDYLEKIIELTQNKEKYNELSNNAIEKSKEYDESHITKLWEEFYIEKYNEHILKTNKL